MNRSEKRNVLDFDTLTCTNYIDDIINIMESRYGTTGNMIYHLPLQSYPVENEETPSIFLTNTIDNLNIEYTIEDAYFFYCKLGY